MFARAGLDLRGARVWLIHAMVAVIDGRRRGWAYILKFRCGDLAWYSKSAEFLCWGLRGRIIDQIELPWRLQTWNLPHSDVRTRREFNWPPKKGEPFFEEAPSPPKRVKAKVLPSHKWKQIDFLEVAE